VSDAKKLYIEPVIIPFDTSSEQLALPSGDSFVIPACDLDNDDSGQQFSRDYY